MDRYVGPINGWKYVSAWHLTGSIFHPVKLMEQYVGPTNYWSNKVSARQIVGSKISRPNKMLDRQ